MPRTFAEMKALREQQGRVTGQAPARTFQEMGSLRKNQAVGQGPQSPAGPSRLEAAGRGLGEGASFGFSGEIGGVMGALWQKAAGDPEKFADLYRSNRDMIDAENAKAKDAHTKEYVGSEILGGVASSVLPVGGPLKAGALYGLGTSQADLTKPSVDTLKEAGKDVALGAATGKALSVASRAVAPALKSVGESLKSLGQSRLFKAAVGQNKRAFVQMNGKGLLEKSMQYLDDLGIGVGDTTESIAEKLAARRDSLGKGLGGVVDQLDQAVGGSPVIKASTVADRIEKEVAGPLKGIVAARGEYRQIMGEVKALRKLEGPLSFSEAASQRRAAQQQINYNVTQGKSIAADAQRKVASLWNDVIDETAEPILRKNGQAGDAYRALRQEFALAEELLGHVQSRVAGNQANRVMSPSTYAAGGIMGVMSHNPVIGIAGAAANHLALKYGNAAAGRTALGMAKMAARNARAAEVLMPRAARGVSGAVIDEQNEEPEQ